MSADLALANLVVDQLADWAPVSARRMFGGVGLFREGRMFGLVFDQTLYLKCADAVRKPFDDIAAPAFTYARGGRTVALSYRQPPGGIIDDPDALTEWARLAWRAARGLPQ
ncbi:TfoX/Sxy family protein [Algiphilus sp.]|uniref:TfoX/Sxy family protein n=1 Tax=Algiphilus sp. TaxID=1872431 RepID=UPI0025BD3AAA|nr:TfoX/Sxy family protein [Algiphilus sp.]MCK5769976.1 TfoX/Sxy family protein [Algiphilus sp.]